MDTKNLTDVTLQIIAGTAQHAIQCFLLDRRSRNLSLETLDFYNRELKLFVRYAHNQGVIMLSDVTPDLIRRYLLDLSQRRNGGGCHAAYRCLRALMIWTWEEFEIESRNPITRVEPPRRNTQPLPGVPLEHVARMVDVCRGDKLALRDKSILYFLTDTGVRAGELLALELGDLDLLAGVATIQHGKGDKRRVVFVGKRTLKALRAYLKTRRGLTNHSPLFAIGDGQHFKISGLRSMVERRAKQAGVDCPALHDFRRCFALECLRNGLDLLTLSRLMGHTSLVVTQRYIDLLDGDMQTAHRRNSPVDNM